MKTKYFRYVIFTLAILLLADCGQTSDNRTQSPFRITLTHEAIIYTTRAALDPQDYLATRQAESFKTMMAITPHYTPPPTPIPPTLTPAIPSSVQSICLNVEQNFGQFEGPFPATRDVAARILQKSHYSVMEVGGNCDATLDIQLTLWPLSETYSNLAGPGSSTCYTGAKASGSATMTVPNEIPQKIELLQVRPPTTGIIVIINTCPAPSQAPFTNPAGRAVLQTLTELVGPQTLLSAVKDEDEQIRGFAVGDLYDLYLRKNYPILSVLLEALEDPASNVRYQTVIILGQMEEDADAAFDKLVSMLQDPEASVRDIVVSYLHRIKGNDPVLIDPYLTALKDPDKGVNRSALSGLGQLGSIAMRAVPDILTYYESHPDETNSVMSCLRHITGQELVNDPAAWRTWWEQGQ